MNVFNVFDYEIPPEPDSPEGYDAPDYRFAADIGASMITARIYEMEPGNSNCPYHYEYGNEEWLLLLRGTLTVRTPEGESEMRAGDVACFPDGPAGAHKLTNNGAEAARFLFFSTDNEPAVAVYPDSDKIGVWPGMGNEDKLLAERSSDVDYWKGEL
jgi:uncharacterized cupin superfamily protein